uniref:4-hydroxy-tetrahydrodipicolinate reductase n=1 Tax=Mitsuokella jalaludinii TaxID=187979 RepID=UPI00307C268B
MTTVIVNGACGRMGQAVLKAVQEADGLELVGAVDIKGGADTGSLVGLPANGILVETDLEALLARKKPEVMVDFTRPDVVFGNVMTALAHKTSPVVGTTGLSDEQKAEIAKAAEANDTPAFIAPNFAIGAVLLMVMSRQAAKYMPDVEIIELHHDKKLDAPSGTAIQTAAMIAEVRKAHKQGNPDEFEKLEAAEDDFLMRDIARQAHA